VYFVSDVVDQLDLSAIHEIEYANELATGAAIASGKVLRVRCYSQTFEFVLPEEVVSKWKLVLPSHGANVVMAPLMAGAAPTLA
jgi:hypothetical protein